jgi:Uma2 family endonuclease
MVTPAPTTSPLARRYRLDEFFALDQPEGGGHWELIAGVLYMVPPPGWSHNVVASRLTVHLAAWVKAHPDQCQLFVPRAPIWTSADTYLEPDFFLVTPERLRAARGEHFEAADLVVEILSPSTAVYDRTAKADTYAALGVRELWLVDLERRTIEQRVLVKGRWERRAACSGDQSVESSSFPGLVVMPGELFEES